ncbi:hypothetical protein OAR31_04720 [Candidatus Marinimicrobia bacterium]|nr:hypothetical protein [Candidatus Neomarinimicrobiota bacterium]
MKRIDQDMLIFGFGIDRKNNHAKNIDFKNEKAYDFRLHSKK